MRHLNNNITKQLSRISAFSILVLLFHSFTLFAQQNTDLKEQRIQNAFAKTVSFYDSKIGSNSMLNTGRSYFDSFIGIKGHQYFEDDYWEEGSLVYDGHAFDSISLRYDIYRDLLLIEHFNSDGLLAPIQLYRPKVSSFELMGYSFIWIEKDTLSNIRTGYYNQMYNGHEIQMLVKRKKNIVRSNGIGTIGEEFLDKDKYYIKKDNIYHQVKKRGSIIKVLADRKKEVKIFIKSNGFRFKTNPDIEMVEVVAYYDSLIK